MKPLQPQPRAKRNLSIATAVISIIIAAAELAIAIKTPIKER